MIRVLTSIAVLGLSSAAIAETPEKTPDEAFQIAARNYISPNRKISYSRNNLMRSFYTTDADGNGKITEEDYELLDQISKANQRSYALQKWSRMDLNGDGKVEKKEMNTIFLSKASQPFTHHGIQISPTREQIALILEKLVSNASDSDTNDDGTISFEEALADANKTLERRRSRYSRPANKPVPASLDKNNDKAVDLEEFKTEVELVIQLIDKDKDGEISNEESNSFRSHTNQLRRKLRK